MEHGEFAKTTMFSAFSQASNRLQHLCPKPMHSVLGRRIHEGLGKCHPLQHAGKGKMAACLV